MAESLRNGPLVLPKFGLKILALFLGAMSWYLIQDAIRLESAQRKTAYEPRAREASTNSVMRLESVPVMVLSKPGVWEWRLEPDKIATVWLEASEADLNQVDPSMVRAFVDGSVITQPGDYMMPVRVYLPVGITVKAVTEPPMVRLTIRPALKGGP